MNTRRNILGGILGSFEEDYERETTVTSVVTQTTETGKFPLKGSIEFQKQKSETERKKIFFQTIREEKSKVQIEEERAFEEEINDIIINLPTAQKNNLLHLQASYTKNKSVYLRAELRKKLIEEQQKIKMQEKTASIPNPAKKSHALETAFEGGSGTQGSGTANLSAQAVG